MTANERAELLGSIRADVARAGAWAGRYSLLRGAIPTIMARVRANAAQLGIANIY